MQNFVFTCAVLFLAVLPFHNLTADDMFPNIAVVNTDTDGLIGAVEKAAAQQFYMNHQDVYDFLFIYTTFTPSMNMQQGLAIQYTVQGINRDAGIMSPYGTPSDWGSAGKLLGAARMCNIDQYPDNPDVAISTNILSPYAGMSSAELLAHEWSHYWLAAMDFKKEGMLENHPGLRGCEGGNENGCGPNQHWSGDFSDGNSVMYGGDITDNGDGSFTYYFGNPKKYGPLDQYVMGLRAPEEVGDLFFLCSSADIEQCREGNPAVPAPKSSAPSTKTGLHKHVVTMDDIIRAMGPRVPSSAESQKHFNVAFIIANKNGFYPFPQQLQKLETLRVRMQEWFTWATDGRGTICTELDGDCENNTGNDDDIIPDEDTFTIDNNITPDEEITPDESVTDNNITPDETDEEVKDENTETPDNSTDHPADEEETGCGCTIVF